MNVSEGVSRLAKLVSALGWAAAAAIFLGTLSSASAGRRYPDWGTVAIGCVVAVLVWAIFQAIVWVIDGFIGNRGAKSNIIFPRLLLFRRRPNHTPTPSLARPDLVGVHGWLFFFVIVLMVFSPLMLISGIFNELQLAEKQVPEAIAEEYWRNYKIRVWSVAGAAIGLMVAAGYRLMTVHNASSVTFAIAALWLCGPVLTLIMILIPATAGAQISDIFASEQTATLLSGSFVSPIIWTIYLKTSRRVRNTYYFKLMPYRKL